MDKETISVDSTLVSKINELLASGFEISPDKLVPSASLVTDLGLDSLDAVDMLVYIEDKFNINRHDFNATD